MSNIRIVIVEDNPADVLMVEEALKSNGITLSLEHYSNGEEAAQAVAIMMEAPNLFLLDLNVPRVHGLELLRIIRACPIVAETPVAIITSSPAAADRRLSKQYGADTYIVKPLGYHEFVASVSAAVGGLLKPKPGGSCRLNVARSHPFPARRNVMIRVSRWKRTIV